MMHAYASVVYAFVIAQVCRHVCCSFAACAVFSKACWVVKCVLGSVGWCCTEQWAWKHYGHTCSHFSGAH